MVARGTLSDGGRTIYAYAGGLISLRLPVAVIERWRATGPGWQQHMADLLSKI